MIASWQESYDKSRQWVEKQRHYSAKKGPYSQGYGLSSGHIRLWKLDHKEGRALKYWCFRTVVLETPLEAKEIKPVSLKGNQPWILFGRTDTETETSILWPPHGNGCLTGKDSDAGKDGGQNEKRVTQDEMVGWHNQFNGHELGQTLEDSEEQGGLSWGSPYGH